MKTFKYLMTFESYSILGRVETVIITNEQGETVTCDAKIDTGSYSSRISGDIAKKLKLPVIDQKKIKSVAGEEDRVFVELQFQISGIEIKTIAGIANMGGLRNEVAIGRRDIEMVDGIVDVKKNNKKPIGIPLNTPVEVEIEVEPILKENFEDPSIDITSDVKDDLKKNFQYWKTGHDNEEDAKDLLKFILKRAGIADGDVVDEIEHIVYDWVGYTPNQESRKPITEGKEEQKYFIWTDKTGRGEKPINLTQKLIEDTWDLEQEDWDGVTLGDFIQDCYIDDVWETREEKLVCDKIY